VGGAPRDMAMGLEPIDYDIATDASPDEVSGLFERTYPVGREFGVSIVMIGGNSFEVSQFRTEGEYIDGRRPSEVKSADETEDVKRRDFTINALLYDPLQDKITDLVSGLDDIKAGIIKTIGDPGKRFSEDLLRMLRAVRFSARFNFRIEHDTFEAIKHNALKINNISPERIGEELSKIFTGNNPAQALTLLDETGLLEAVLPEVHSLKGVDQPKKYHPEGDVFAHTRLMLEQFGVGSVTLAFGILLHDIAKPVTSTKTDRIRFNLHDTKGKEIAGTIMRRLRFANDIVSQVQSLVSNHMRFINVPHMKQSTLRRFIALEGFDELLELFRLDCLASHGNLEIYDFLKNEIGRELKENNSLRLPELLVSGKDLISIGYKPGRIFNKILKTVQDAQLEGDLTSKKGAVEFIRKEYPLNSH
ncbi:CCA tRNA nucleotidyltransferase, partial [Candidatus Latescibacterota bacterium]